MTKNRIIIEDPNDPVPGTTLDQRLKKYEEQKQEYSAQREEERLNAPTTIEKWIASLKRLYAKTKQTNKKSQNKTR